MSSIHDFEAKDISGQTVSLKEYKDQAVLIVNTASACGFTPQYKGLEEIHKKYKDQGLAVLGFPCNQFGAQEPGSEEEIKTFCERNYGVTFKMFSKVEVNGAEAHPLFQYLTGEQGGSPGDVKWNFEKFLIGKDGQLKKRFSSRVKPEGEQMSGAIAEVL